VNLPNDIILEAGNYWFRVVGTGVNWYYQSSGNPYENGSRQQFSSGTWSNIANTDAYFVLLLNNADLRISYSQESLPDVIDDVFNTESTLAQKGSLVRNYSQITKGQVDDLGRNLSFSLRADTVKRMFETVHGMATLGWWWAVDPGTNEFTIQEQPSVIEHIFYAGKDMLDLKIRSSITSIKNDVLFTGGTINEAQDTLTIRTIDTDSIRDFRRGLTIKSDGRVFRYDTAQSFSDFEIASSRAEHISTDIVIQAKTYDIETIRVGHLCTLVNTGGESITLQIATVNYTPTSVGLSLSNMPSTLLRNIDNINKALEQQLTLAAENAL
jgi:hypothetical protein